MKEQSNSIINSILDCSHLKFTESHRFEEHINGNPVFRAKKEHLHTVYCINKEKRIIFFLRAVKHFSKYGRLHACALCSLIEPGYEYVTEFQDEGIRIFKKRK